MPGGPDYLSDNETQVCQPGQVVVNAGADRWVTWANGGSTLSTAMVGLCLRATLPGGQMPILTIGRFPYNSYNLGPGNASPIIAGVLPTRGNSTQGPVIGACDASGEIFMLPFGCSSEANSRIAENGTVLPPEPIVNLIGPGVSGVDNPGAGRTDITIASGITTVESSGTTLPREPIINFASGATAVDDPSFLRTNVTIDAYTTVEVAGSPVAAERKLNFVSGATVVDNPGAGSTDVTITGGGGGSPGNVFVYRVGATPSGNIFSSFAAAYTARQAAGGFAIIEIDNASGTATIGAGTYNLFDTRLLGTPQPSGQLAILQIPNGVTLVNLEDIENLEIQTTGSSPVISLSAGATNVALRNSTINATSAAQLWSLSGSASLVVALHDLSTLTASGGDSVFHLAGSAGLQIGCYGESEVDSCVSGSSGVLNIFTDSAGIIAATQPLFTGTYNLHFVSLASQEAYTPATPGNWSPAPSLVAPALDQLAARSSGGATPLTPPSNGSWSVANWYIDPNAGSDSNTGLTALSPLKHYYALVAKWGTVSPVLPQATTLHFLSGPNDLDPVVWKPYTTDNVTITGPLNTVAAGVVLGSVVAKSTTAGSNSSLHADLGGSASTGMLVHNTTAGKNSYAWVYFNVSGTVWQLSQPVDPRSPGNPTGQGIDTWANGDTVDLLLPTNVDVTEFVVVNTFQSGAHGNLYQVGVSSAADGNNMVLCNVYCLESRLGRGVMAAVYGTSYDGASITDDSDTSIIVANCAIFNGCHGSGTWILDAGCGFNNPHTFINAFVGVRNDAIIGDCRFDSCHVHMYGGFPASNITGVFIDGNASFYNSYIVVDGTFTAIYGSTNGFLNLFGTTILYNNVGSGEPQGSFTPVFTAPNLVAPGVLLNGAASGNGRNLGTGAISALYTTTPAHLDSPPPGAGFVRGAWVIGGAGVGNIS